MAIYAQDIMLDNQNDLLIRNGDFVADLSDEDHISDILLATPGTYKQYPMLGVAIVDELNSPNGAANIKALERKIQINLTVDNYNITQMDLSTKENFTLQAERIK